MGLHKKQRRSHSSAEQLKRLCECGRLHRLPHADLAAGFHKTGMGRSILPVASGTRSQIRKAVPSPSVGQLLRHGRARRALLSAALADQGSMAKRRMSKRKNRVDYVVVGSETIQFLIFIWPDIWPDTSASGPAAELVCGKGRLLGRRPGYDQPDFPGKSAQCTTSASSVITPIPKFPKRSNTQPTRR